MALKFAQRPRYETIAAEQEIIFAIEETGSKVEDESKVKFVAKVNVGSDSSALTEIGVFKTTPNAAEVGIFDFGTILKNYVSPDYTGMSDSLTTSQYKGTDYSMTDYHPIHVIDEFCLGHSSTTWFQIDFAIEYLGANSNFPNLVAEHPSLGTSSDPYFLYNGVVYDTDPLDSSYSSNVYKFGYNLNKLGGYISNATTVGGALSDAPKVQYARLTDYGTLPYFSGLNGNTQSFAAYQIEDVTVEMYGDSGLLGSFSFQPSSSNGGYNGSPSTTLSEADIMYIGCFPANFDGAGHTFWTANKAACTYYKVRPETLSVPIGEFYTINIICDDARGYEGVRLTWLNKQGTWDYYTFNKKSVRSVSSRRKTYTQLGGTWNESIYKLRGSSGGRKNFKVDSKEKIKVNTDYVSELDSVWFEQLMNSPEVFILNEYQSDSGGVLRRYVQPVTITTSNYTRKTVANDRLIQYSFEVERTTNLRTQSV
ncbi:MAG: hypothetical protein CMC55_00915 [Flavobacteriaceae bacterium]|nr:hypothetical protein [Flavobacteriaceae bacterium]